MTIEFKGGDLTSMGTIIDSGHCAYVILPDGSKITLVSERIGFSVFPGWCSSESEGEGKILELNNGDVVQLADGILARGLGI